MDETRIIICAVGDAVTLWGRNEHEVVTLSIAVGESFEVKLRGEWCWVRLESGGYKGRYYVTAAGERGRLALGMEARPCKQVQGEQMGVAPPKKERYHYGTVTDSASRTTSPALFPRSSG